MQLLLEAAKTKVVVAAEHQQGITLAHRHNSHSVVPGIVEFPSES